MHKIAASFQQRDIDLLARCKPPSGIESRGFVDRKIAPVDLHMPEREKPGPEDEEAGRGHGRDRSFSGPAIVLGRSESRGSALDQPRIRASGAT